MVFENVWFRYHDRADWVLQNLSFRVAPGERVAFVGATGAGKTTIIKLLSRLYDVSRGRILVDGVDIREVPQSELRRRVATVLRPMQQTTLSLNGWMRVNPFKVCSLYSVPVQCRVHQSTLTGCAHSHLT